jgi:hypothetical protein
MGFCGDKSPSVDIILTDFRAVCDYTNWTNVVWDKINLGFMTAALNVSCMERNFHK